MRCTYWLWLGALVLCTAGWDCGDKPDSCPDPQRNFVCPVDLKPIEGCGDACGMLSHDSSKWYCALNAADAASKVGPYWAMRGYVATLTKDGCWRPNGETILSDDPPFTAQDLGTCDANASDNACVSCAKAACCSEYAACISDPVCLCWVGCKAAGNPDAVCALPANCGPLDATSSAADACLDAQCSPQCNGVASMGGTCMCAGGSAPPPTAPPPTCGTFWSGQACLSDSDCASCSCSTWTMTCD